MSTVNCTTPLPPFLLTFLCSLPAIPPRLAPPLQVMPLWIYGRCLGDAAMKSSLATRLRLRTAFAERLAQFPNISMVEGEGAYVLFVVAIAGNTEVRAKPVW